ncbi:MAG: hypothetical protein ACRDA4_00285 [Filifactoraceae bacterium]
MEEIKTLIEKALEKEREIREISKDLDEIKVKLQSYATEEMENKNIKYLEIFAESGSVSSYYKEKFEVDNLAVLKELMGESLTGKIEIEQKENIKVESKVKEALIALYKNSYCNGDINQVIDTFSIDDKAKKLLLKKLKGDYRKDIKLLRSFGLEGDFEEELDAIHDIKNYELVKKFFQYPEQVDRDKLMRAISVETVLALGINQFE